MSDSDSDSEPVQQLGPLRLQTANHAERAAVSKAKQELDRYRLAVRLEFSRQAAPADDGDDNRLEGVVTMSNPLLWWKRNRGEYKYLSQLARRVLCVQATSAPTERLFSVAGMTITNLRARLQPELAEEILFIHANWDIVERYLAEMRQKRMNND
jgi:hypothetical protein